MSHSTHVAGAVVRVKTIWLGSSQGNAGFIDQTLEVMDLVLLADPILYSAPCSARSCLSQRRHSDS
ncbi:hypothetical protein KCP73_16470 [Salmonella enterica subsp. enterica]|nr:hypothetical protein KCP73_16470 [Salmonella enterica subsp. enterica]